MRPTSQTLDWVDRQLGRLAGLFAICGALAITGLMAITVVAVFWRYGLNNPIFGIEDLSVITLTIVAAAAVAHGGRTGAHVSVNLIGYVFGRKVTRYTDAVMRVLTVAICALAVYALFTKACGMEKACITGNFSIIHRPYYYVLGLAMAIYCAQMLLHLIVGLIHWHDPRDPNEPED